MSVTDGSLSVAVIVPTCNPGADLGNLLDAVRSQRADISRRLIIDSSSTDGSLQVVDHDDFEIQVIDRSAFDHGGTRSLALDLITDCEFVVFLTQDAIPADEQAIANILRPFDDVDVAISYGRQLPRPGAGAIESFHRLHNYTGESHVYDHHDIALHHLKTAYNSNSFSAYRVSALESLGRFESGTIFGEDMLVAARAILEGYKVAYAADACVYHSHAYTLRQEFARYFDVGVFHNENGWLMDSFGRAEGEGLRYVINEWMYLLRRSPFRIFESLMRNILRYSAYRLGRSASIMPVWLCKRLSMNPGYFDKVQH